MTFICEVEVAFPVPTNEQEARAMLQEVEQVQRELTFLLHTYRQRRPLGRRRVVNTGVHIDGSPIDPPSKLIVA